MKVGDRIELIEMGSDPLPIEPGTRGTILNLPNSFGQINVKWDDGRMLYLLDGEDIYKIIDDERTEMLSPTCKPGSVIFPHGTTPTGFGLRYRSNGTLRPLSKCCGRSMVNDKDYPPEAKCKGCGKDYTEDSNKQGCSFANDVPLPNGATDSVIISWIEKVTGYSGVEVSLD